jgi:uncharacterized protein
MNPFTNRGAITNPDDFFGRTEQLTEIITRLQRMQSSSVVGERRIGKSSLLYYLTQTGVEKLADKNYRFLYVDMTNARFFTANGFFRYVLKKLGVNDEVVKDDNKPDRNLYVFTDELETLANDGQRTVLCLDEFENAFAHPREFSEDFFDHMRSQLHLSKFAFVTATKTKLRDLCSTEILTSDFYNIFTVIPLGDFPEDEAHQFVATYHQRVSFTDDELQFVLSYPDPHPLKLQIRCDCVLRNRQKQLADWALIDAINTETSEFFNVKYDMKKMKKNFSLDSLTKILSTIKSGRDLITGK